MIFCTAVNCMDGRVQLPLIKFMQKRFNAGFVDIITEPGPNLILAKQTDTAMVESILRRMRLSVDAHASGAIALAGHYGCVGNPAGEEEQKQHLDNGVGLLRSQFETLPVIGVWIDSQWKVHEVM